MMTVFFFFCLACLVWCLFSLPPPWHPPCCGKAGADCSFQVVAAVVDLTTRSIPFSDHRFANAAPLSLSLSLALRLQAMKAILNRATHVVPLPVFTRVEQEEVMRFVFKNEDRVWRYRGGRDGAETFEQFLNFVRSAPVPEGGSTVDRDAMVEADGNGSDDGNGNGVSGGAGVEDVSAEAEEKFGGVVAILARNADDGLADVLAGFQIRDLIGYAVGEFTTLDADDDLDDDDVGGPDGRNGTSGRLRRRGRASRGGPAAEEGTEAADGGSQSNPLAGVQAYEVVTAWVDERCRGLDLATRMYFDIARCLWERDNPCTYVLCDVIEGRCAFFFFFFFFFCGCGVVFRILSPLSLFSSPARQ